MASSAPAPPTCRPADPQGFGVSWFPTHLTQIRKDLLRSWGFGSGVTGVRKRWSSAGHKHWSSELLIQVDVEVIQILVPESSSVKRLLLIIISSIMDAAMFLEWSNQWTCSSMMLTEVTWCSHELSHRYTRDKHMRNVLEDRIVHATVRYRSHIITSRSERNLIWTMRLAIGM